MSIAEEDPLRVNRVVDGRQASKCIGGLTVCVLTWILVGEMIAAVENPQVRIRSVT